MFINFGTTSKLKGLYMKRWKTFRLVLLIIAYMYLHVYYVSKNLKVGKYEYIRSLLTRLRICLGPQSADCDTI